MCFLFAGQDMVPEPPIQDEEGATGEGHARPTRRSRGCRRHHPALPATGGGAGAGQGRQALHRWRQGTSAVARRTTHVTLVTPSPRHALVHPPTHPPSPSAAASPRLVVVHYLTK